MWITCWFVHPPSYGRDVIIEHPGQGRTSLLYTLYSVRWSVQSGGGGVICPSVLTAVRPNYHKQCSQLTISPLPSNPRPAGQAKMAGSLETSTAATGKNKIKVKSMKMFLTSLLCSELYWAITIVITMSCPQYFDMKFSFHLRIQSRTRIDLRRT